MVSTSSTSNVPRVQINSVSVRPKTRAEKVRRVALIILFVFVSIACAFFQLPLLTAGFFLGAFACKDKMKQVNQDIVRIWKRRPIAMTAITLGTSLIGAFPIIIGIGATCVGAELGRRFTEYRQRRV